MPAPAAQWLAPSAQLPAPSFAEGVLTAAEEAGADAKCLTVGLVPAWAANWHGSCQ